MVSKIQTELLCAMPPAPRHSITTHMPGWDLMLKFVARDPEIMTNFKSIYPRMMPHPDVRSVITVIMKKYGKEGQGCFLFSTRKAADDCKAYGLSKLRGDDMLQEDELSVRVFDIQVRLYAVFFPAPKQMSVKLFFTNAGLGISSRLGEECMKHIDLLHEVTDDSPPPKLTVSPAHKVIKERIADLLERAPAGPPRAKKVSAEDVFLFPTGMAAIYALHQTLQSHYQGTSILFGWAFHSTSHIFQDWDSTGYKSYGLGNAKDLADVEVYLKEETKAGRKIHALYTEIPANPLIVTPNLLRLRELADQYHFLIIVDDTVGSFCNVDVLPAADITTSSLTKSFSGYANVMGASIVLNPNFPHYEELKPLFETNPYGNDYCNGDAEALESNSRDYMARSAKLNHNAESVTAYLQTRALDPSSNVAKVWYTTVSPTIVNYTPFMRQKTEDFTPGYGCLFSVELVSLAATIAFYNNLHVHMGPHLGAHLTLGLPYTRALYANELEWAAQYDMKETQIRISVGLEDTEELLEVFKAAVEEADKA